MTSQAFEYNYGFRFSVTIDGIHNILFTECRLPNLQVDTEQIKEGGMNGYSHVLPTRVNAGTISLKHGMTSDLALLNWYAQVMRGDLANAYRVVTVRLIDTARIPMVTWTFRDAFPTKWSGPSLRAGASEIAIEELELVYHGFEFGP
jgi:phage tail-like protein